MPTPPSKPVSDGESIKRNTNLLRNVLGKMGSHADGYDPVSYSLWYEYARGALPDLRKEVDQLLLGGPRLTAEQTHRLFETHVRDQAQAAFANARIGLLAVLSQVQASIGDAATSSAAYDAVLRSFEGGIGQSESIGDMRQELSGVLAHTHEIRSSIASLSDELLSNRAQVNRLTEELQKLREDVLTDPLTGLVNRRGFDQTIVALKAAASDGEPFSLVMIDIDHFKKINDTHGHLIGDRVIQQVASTMRSCVRGGDTAARYGGEEFALLLPATSTRGAQTVAEYIGNALRKERVGALKPDGGVGPVTVSSGVATYRSGESVEACIDRADRALYAAKQGGRNRVHVAG